MSSVIYPQDALERCEAARDRGDIYAAIRAWKDAIALRGTMHHGYQCCEWPQGDGECPYCYCERMCLETVKAMA